MHVIIEPVDNVWIRLDCEEAVAREIHTHFSFDVPGAKFSPAFRKRQWSGKIHLFKLNTRTLYRGLLPRLLQFAESQQYTVENRVPTPSTSFDEDKFLRWIAAQELPVVPRDYQLAAVRYLLLARRGIVLSPTGSGKSLIIHLLTACLNLPTLIVVPNTSLVAQLAADLIAYGVRPERIQTIQAGRDKTQSAPIVISTWQSIYQLPPSYFHGYPVVIVDEVHLAKAKSLTGLMEKCTQTQYRLGFTGTLDDLQVNQLVLEGLFGDVHRVTTTAALMAQQQLTPLRVRMCVVKYPVSVCKELRGLSYQDEVDYLVQHPQRLDIVARLAASTPGNVLVLFNFVEKHGMPLYQRTQDIVGQTRDVHFVSGAVAGSERERIRQWVTSQTNQIIIASYGTFSTGINIPNLHAIVFASPSKSKIRVLQSIGRGLRVHADKTHVTLLDVVDDLRTGSAVNHTMRHAQTRVQYYAAEQFPYTVLELSPESWVQQLAPRCEILSRRLASERSDATEG